MSESERKAQERVHELIRQRCRIGIKRWDPFLTLLRVAMLRSRFRVICASWDR